MGIDGNGRLTVLNNEAALVLQPDRHIGHISQIDRRAIAPGEDHGTEILGTVGPGKTNGITPLAHFGETGRDILGPHQTDHFGQLDPQARRLVWVKGDAQLLLAATMDLRHRHPGHPLAPTVLITGSSASAG